MKTNTKLRLRSLIADAFKAGKLICLAAALALTPLVADLAHAGLNQQISEEDWRNVLGEGPSDDTILITRSTELLTESTKAQNAGASDEAMRKRVMGLVLARYVNDRTTVRTSTVRANYRALNKAEAALFEQGVSGVELKAARIALEAVLGKVRPYVPPASRVATKLERSRFIEIMRNNLIDPESAIYGDAHVIGNSACMTVNSKNRFGGYTGKQEAVFDFDPTTRKWGGGAVLNLPHGVCIDLHSE